MDVVFWFGRRWMLVEWTLDLGWVDVGFWLYGRWIFGVLTFDFDCLDDKFRLFW